MHFLGREWRISRRSATLPLAVAAYGDSAQAIGLSRYLAEHTPSLTGTRKETVLFNLANLLVEQSVDGPPLSPAEQEALTTEVMALIGQCEQLRKVDESAFVDLEGLLIVAASNDPAEIRKAIEQLQKGRDNCLPEDREYAEACFESERPGGVAAPSRGGAANPDGPQNARDHGLRSNGGRQNGARHGNLRVSCARWGTDPPQIAVPRPFHK